MLILPEVRMVRSIQKPVTKLGLSNQDDNIYWHDDLTSLPYGHYLNYI